MKCPYCDNILKEGKTALTFQMSDDRIIVVKDVPALICEECGEESVDIKDSKIVEKLVHKAIADGITMGFIIYNNAA
ncbi:MAG: YgiT-type zinc finger protein [Bacteroidetes bacterium]|nr:YgiT-type zinc finger protein [Bacteroidota bacterium]